MNRRTVEEGFLKRVTKKRPHQNEVAVAETVTRGDVCIRKRYARMVTTEGAFMFLRYLPLEAIQGQCEALPFVQSACDPYYAV